MLVTWYDFLCHSDVTSLPPLYRYPLSIAWLRVRVARYTHPVYSPSSSCHSDVTSLPPLYRYPLSIAWLRVRVARYTFLFSLAWPWRMKSLVKHNMLKAQTAPLICIIDKKSSIWLLSRNSGKPLLGIKPRMVGFRAVTSPWRWRQYRSLKCHKPSLLLHGHNQEKQDQHLTSNYCEILNLSTKLTLINWLS